MASAWWKSSIGYMIYPESFKDSNGDGIGDLGGIISKLDYLHDLGVDLLWIGPLFDSPMDDNGYDVRDYRKINPLYGTMDDLKRLFSEAHARNMRVLLDFPINHTSDEHPWFQKALSDPSSKERGYYYFKKGKGENLPPNNWAGFFSTSAWEKAGNEYYLHIFTKKMPDLNWENPELRKEIYDIARFYLELGCDGFRLDAVTHLAKDLSFEDSAMKPDPNGLVLDTSKFSNRPRLYDYLSEFREEVFSHYDCLVVGEAGGCISPEESLKLVEKPGAPLNMVFNFDTVWNNGNFDSIKKKDEEIFTDVFALRRNFMRWYEVLNGKADMPLYWCNHDHPRVVSQYGSVAYRNESAKMLFLTLLFLYGTPFIYNGEEIGMSNANYGSIGDFGSDRGTMNSVEAYKKEGYDEETILHYLNRTSRVNARTPMQWDRSENAGFGSKPAINKVNPNYLEGVNVYDEMCDPYSILNFYQYAIALRKNPTYADAVEYGRLSYVDPNHPDVFSYLHEGGTKLMVISNFRPYTVYFTFYYEMKDVLLHNYDGVLLKDHVITLRPFESFLLVVR